jgi:hypothetical protein
MRREDKTVDRGFLVCYYDFHEVYLFIVVSILTIEPENNLNDCTLSRYRELFLRLRAIVEKIDLTDSCQEASV